MKITHEMIAAEAGVSQSTVSKALRDSGEISDKTALRIRNIAEQMGYFKEKKARLRRTMEYLYPHVAVLVPEIIGWSYALAVTSLQNRIEAIGGTVQIYLTKFDEARFSILVDRLNRESFADIILSFASYTYTGRSRLPIGYMTGHSPEDPNCAFSVSADVAGGYEDAVRHLYKLGHRKIGFLGEENTTIKQQFFCDAMEKCGCRIRREWLIKTQSRFEQIGHEGVAAMCALSAMPTALVTAYDEVAFGAVRELRRRGFRVPEDISVVGCNDTHSAACMDPPLTTIRIHSEARTDAVVRLICAVLEGNPLSVEEMHLSLPAPLIIRESTCRPR